LPPGYPARLNPVADSEQDVNAFRTKGIHRPIASAFVNWSFVMFTRSLLYCHRVNTPFSLGKLTDALSQPGTVARE
jgi:hypothetical protein